MSPSAVFSDMLNKEIERMIKLAIEEDFGSEGDVTSKSVIDEPARVRAELIVKSPGVIAGLLVAEKAFHYLDSTLEFKALAKDGDFAEAGTRIAEVSGSAGVILGAERTALNFLQHLSGVATETGKYKAEISGYKAELLDTRKTTPGLRFLEKYAAGVGGATNHRLGLFDQILIKDNHIKIAGGNIEDAVKRAREKYPLLKVEVETETIEEVEAAIQAEADIILLDNMDVARLKESVDLIAGRAITEASGGIKLANIAAVAATGVDRISVGAITQAAKPLDISLEILD